MNISLRLCIFLLVQIPFASAENLYDYKKRAEGAKLQLLRKVEGKKSSVKFQALTEEEKMAVVMSASGDHYLGDILIANVHGDNTVKALENELSLSCLNFLIEENVNVDKGELKEDKTNHFDNNLICKSYKVLEDRLQKIPQLRDTRLQLSQFAKVIHAIQDFYSHSNYLQAVLTKNDSLKKEEVPEFDFAIFCPKGKTYKDIGEIFTGSYDGNHGAFDSKITKEDLENPKSHLHWNKDFSPYENYYFAKSYSRSSLMRSQNGKGIFYFDYVESLQTRVTIRLFKQVQGNVKGLDMTCKI